LMAGSTSLCPGFKHVEKFGPDEDYEDEEEISYITLDLGSIEPTLIPSSSTYRLIGLDTPTPFLQLSGTFFKGRHDSLLGTELIFTEDNETHDWNKRSVIHVANTEQRICFNEVRLQPKAHGDSSRNGTESSGDNTAQTVTEDAAEKIDRLTGKVFPGTRASAKGVGTRSKRLSAKEKGKAKAKDPNNSPTQEPMVTRVKARDKGKDTGELYTMEVDEG